MATSPPADQSSKARDQLFVAACSITPTKRRRFLWAAWWTAPPRRDPFQKPDAFSGGARTHVEALAEAHKAAGRPLTEIEPRWARAWARVREGRPAFAARREPDASSARARPPVAPAANSIWEVLGIAPDANAAALKRAYRQRALATHPDRGGDPEAFRAVQRAFAEARRRIDRRGPARKPRP